MKVTVKKQTEIGSKNFGIYVNGTLVEGGFFCRSAALSAAEAYKK